MKKLSFFFAVILFFVGCLERQSSDTDLDSAFVKAKSNRTELEKVIRKYSAHKKDSLQLKAAIFLIRNMPDYFYYEGKGISDFCNYFKALKLSSKDPEEILDSINAIYGVFQLNLNSKKFDIENIDSAYLCNNIELAFKAWKGYPWSRNYSFDDFCDYILPYRIGNEKLTNWRSIYYKEYASILDSVKSANPIEVAKILRDSIIRRQGNPRFTMTRPSSYPTLDAKNSMFTSGACMDLSQFTISLFRTFGIASCEDIMPIRGDANVGHSWVALFNSEYELYNTDFFGAITYVSETMINRLSSKPKVYRKKYSSVKNELSHGEEFIPGGFLDLLNGTIDVTKLYANNLTKLQLTKTQLYRNEIDSKIVYLCAPSWLNWTPVAWTKLDENGGVTFENIDGGSILRVAYYDNGNLRFISSPFYINRQNKDIVFFAENEEVRTENAILYSKFILNREILYRNRLVGGVFEGADNKDFINPDTIVIIKNMPFKLYTDAYVNVKKAYKFLRYKGPPNSYCNIAEIEIYSGKDKLAGDIIGSAGSQKDNPKYEYPAAFDGFTETSFDHSTPDEGWVGISLDKPKSITRIRYVPRNYDNYIKPGNEYELFISRRDGWASLGRKTAVADSLVYEKVPQNALLYLKNHSGGQEERIFLMKDGKQVFK